MVFSAKVVRKVRFGTRLECCEKVLRAAETEQEKLALMKRWGLGVDEFGLGEEA